MFFFCVYKYVYQLIHLVLDMKFTFNQPNLRKTDRVHHTNCRPVPLSLYPVKL